MEQAARLMQMATGYWASAALNAAVHTGVFDAIGGGRVAGSIVAERCGSDASYTAALLDGLAGLGLLDKDEGGYAISPAYRDLLDPAGAHCMLDALRFNGDLYPLWGKLGQSVATGQPALPPEAHLGKDPAQTERFVRGMHSRAQAIGPMITGAVDVTGITKLLDVGAGPGTFARMLLARQPELNITLLDLPPVLDVARTLGEDDRLTFHPGNYRTDALPGGFDGIWFCGALHQETEDGAAALFAKCYEALGSGGVMVVVDLMLDATRTRPVFSALFDVNMKLMNPTARVFTAHECEELLIDAGFCGVTINALGESGYHILRAERL